MAKKDNISENNELETLKKQIEEKDKKLSEYEDLLKRLQAEFENYKKRTENEKRDTMAYANEKIIVSLLDILDNFERAMGEIKKTGETEKIKTGVELIFKQLYHLLKCEGVEEIEALETQFDPEKHEALMQLVSEKHDEDTVVQEMQKGYMLKDKVIRPAKVAVSKKGD